MKRCTEVLEVWAEYYYLESIPYRLNVIPTEIQINF